jgi:hypothetical protein
LENLTTSTCKAASTIDCGNHAGWESDGSMASGTAITRCSYATAYQQTRELGEALDRAAVNPGSSEGGRDFSTLIRELKRIQRAGTSFYSDRGYAKDHPPAHSHAGYPTSVKPAPCSGGRCGQ